MAAPNVALTTIANFAHMSIVQVALTPAAAGAATATEQTFTVTGLSVGDTLQVSDVILSVTKPTAQTGLAVGPARVTAVNTIGIVFVNPTIGAITPTAGETYTITVYRPCQLGNANATIV